MRLGWWEDSPTTHRSLREAMTSALTRTVDVDEDTGVPPVLSLPRLADGVVEHGMTALGAAMGQIPLHPTPRGWELDAHASLRFRRARGHVRELLDLTGEMLGEGRLGEGGRVMVHVPGPWTVGAQVEYRGRPVVADRPAFRDTALTLAAGVADVRRTVAGLVGPGCGVVVAIHEPALPGVVAGLPGPTRWDGVDPVDRGVVAAVLRRFLGTVGTVGSGDTGEVTTVLDPGAVDPAVLTTLGEAGAGRLVVPEATVATTAGADAVGALIGDGQGIGWAVDPAGRAVADADDVARALIRQWDRWTFAPGDLTSTVDLVVAGPRGSARGVGDGRAVAGRTPAEAAEAAALVRTAAALLHRN
ncbi:hypothetical protein [Corynebacterium bovis]|uniref:hypothetical protein n=6 Tax=Corynebacterium bovis TaxID=36808 RepID=UPI000F62EC75|nr:hypothetical protein [Corynebacterium bovis]